MVEYSYEEALELLQLNIASATDRLAQIDADLAFLRDAIITTEVNIARIFNHDVRRRRKVRRVTLIFLPGKIWLISFKSESEDFRILDTDDATLWLWTGEGRGTCCGAGGQVDLPRSW